MKKAVWIETPALQRTQCGASVSLPEPFGWASTFVDALLLSAQADNRQH